MMSRSQEENIDIVEMEIGGQFRNMHALKLPHHPILKCPYLTAKQKLKLTSLFYSIVLVYGQFTIVLRKPDNVKLNTSQEFFVKNVRRAMCTSIQDEVE